MKKINLNSNSETIPAKRKRHIKRSPNKAGRKTLIEKEKEKTDSNTIAVRESKQRRQIENKNSALCPPEVLKQIHLLAAEYGERRFSKLSALLNIPATRLSFWDRNDADFRFSLQNGLDKFYSGKVEKSLIKMALGFYYEETTEQDIETYGKTLDGAKVLVPAHKKITHRKFQAPSVTAICTYLQNRMPDRWKNTYRVETKSEEIKTSNVEHNLTVDLSTLDKKDLELLRNIVSRMESNNAREIKESSNGGNGRSRTIEAELSKGRFVAAR